MESRYEEYHSGEVLLPCIPFLNVKRFADQAVQISNWHDNIEVHLCTQGEGYVLIDGEKHSIAEGDVVVINSNQVHYSGTDTALVFQCLIIDTMFCRIADVPYRQLQFETCFRDDAVAALINEAIRLQGEREDLCHVLKMQATVARLLVALRERHVVSVGAQTTIKPSLENVRNAIRFIREHYAERITLDCISRHILTDKYGLCKSFKKLTGQTVVQYINNYRCEKAKEFLRSGKTVSETALLCGFQNMSFFTKTFKEKTGKLPSAYKHK
ncbi:MAG: helix-turn-helix transcriptional regulator [Clostridia bacterium]|nr:helix-turn-helix transcriptional regulator [Clostridia bacterium]